MIRVIGYLALVLVVTALGAAWYLTRTDGPTLPDSRGMPGVARDALQVAAAFDMPVAPVPAVAPSLPSAPDASPGAGVPAALKTVVARGRWFTDRAGRVRLLRGVNLGGSSKVPFDPPMPTASRWTCTIARTTAPATSRGRTPRSTAAARRRERGAIAGDNGARAGPVPGGLGRLTRPASTHAAAHNVVRLLLAEANRPAEARAAFERAVALDRYAAAYWVNLGNARLVSGDPGAAEAVYREALRLNPGSIDATNGLGVLLVNTGRGADGSVPRARRGRLAGLLRFVVEPRSGSLGAR